MFGCGDLAGGPTSQISLHGGPDPGDALNTAAGDPMVEALRLADRGRCGASPNPMVGAVVTDSTGKVIGRGWHAMCGGPHAEVAALAEAGDLARGATLWVTLEPCAHQGRTPPCSKAVVDAGITRVIIAMADPNPTASGGANLLRAAGIEVTLGHREPEARRLNRRWLRSVTDGRPWITQKAAVSLDGRIATRSGQSKWITGESALHRSLELREEHDAILVGIGTVLADDPHLTRRLGLNPGQLWKRVVLDSLLRTPSSARIVRDNPESTVVLHTAAAGEADRSRLESLGVVLHQAEADADGRIDIATAAAWLLTEHGISSLLVEGGAEVHGSFADADLVDEVVFFVAPLIFGGNAPVAVRGRGVDTIADARRYCFETPELVGEDIEIRGSRPDPDPSDENKRNNDVHRVD